jgi:hypothetical protein
VGRPLPVAGRHARQEEVDEDHGRSHVQVLGKLLRVVLEVPISQAAGHGVENIPGEVA